MGARTGELGRSAPGESGAEPPPWREWVRGDLGDFDRLAQSEDARAVEPLVQAPCLCDGGSEVHQAAAEALARLGTRARSDR